MKLLLYKNVYLHVFVYGRGNEKSKKFLSMNTIMCLIIFVHIHVQCLCFSHFYFQYYYLLQK